MFENYPNKDFYEKQRNVLLNGTRIGLKCKFPRRVQCINPKFDVNEKIGIGQQVLKWLQTGIALGPITEEFAKINDITLNQLFECPNLTERRDQF